MKIDKWLSAALEDDKVCQAMKEDINEYFKLSEWNYNIDQAPKDGTKILVAAKMINNIFGKTGILAIRWYNDVEFLNKCRVAHGAVKAILQK